MKIKNKLIFGGIATLLCGLFAVPLLVDHTNNIKADAATYEVDNVAASYTKNYYQELETRLSDMPSGVNTRTWKFALVGYLTQYPTQSELTELIVQQQKSNDVNYLVINYRFNFNSQVAGSAGVWNGEPSLSYVTNTIVYVESYTPSIIISTDGVLCPFSFEELVNVIDYDTTFTFNKLFNYNAFIQYRYCEQKQIDVQPSLRSLMPYYATDLVYNSTDFPDVLQTYKYAINGGFYSNGRYYTHIIVDYAFIAQPDNFQDKDNQIITANNQTLNGNVTFLKMYYYNDAGNYQDEVCGRQYGYYDNRGSYYPYEPVWSNNSYQNLLMSSDVNQTNDVDYVMKMINNLHVYDGFNIQSNDAGLGDAFTLLGNAFTAMTSIFNITIIPGITIGLLLFLPLIAGVIVLIIWVVKR